MILPRRAGLSIDDRPGKAGAMRKITFAMNVSVDGYVAAPGDDLSWGVPSDEWFQFWSDRVAATDLALYGRRLWETMSSHWPTADQQPGATPAAIEFAGRWRDIARANPDINPDRLRPGQIIALPKERKLARPR